MPALYIIGGANGAGKTTLYTHAVENGYVDPNTTYLNTDNIQKDLGGYTKENSLKAEQMARDQMKDLISANTDFIIESNLATSADYEWIEGMRKAGYTTSLFFLGTSDIDINKLRVKQRVTEGGHDVPEAIIEHRYRIGLTYLKKEILAFDQAHLFNADGNPVHKTAELIKGEIQYKTTDLPQWAKEVLFLAERLQQKREQGLGPTLTIKPDSKDQSYGHDHSQRR